MKYVPKMHKPLTRKPKMKRARTLKGGGGPFSGFMGSRFWGPKMVYKYLTEE